MRQSCPNGVRFAVIESLQKRLVQQTGEGTLTERRPGSRASAEIEKAIDYALSPSRTQSEPTFLEYEVRRNARTAVKRVASAEARVLASIATLTAPAHRAFTGTVLTSTPHSELEHQVRRHRTRTCGPAGKVAGTEIDVVLTPEDVVVTADLEFRLRTQVRAEAGEVAAAVFDGLISEHSVKEIAAGLGVSTRTVERARTKIRAITTMMMMADSYRSAA